MPSSILGPKLDILLKQIECYEPDNYIEIGCYRCHTLKTVSDKFLSIKKLYGLDLFEDAPDYEIPPLDGPPLSLNEAKAYVPKAIFIKGDSKETMGKLPRLSGKTFIFVDGGHSTETALADIRNAIIKYPKAFIILDDSTMPEVKKALEASGLAHEDLGYSLVRIVNE